MTKFFQKYQRENRLNMTRNEEARRKRAGPPLCVHAGGPGQQNPDEAGQTSTAALRRLLFIK